MAWSAMPSGFKFLEPMLIEPGLGNCLASVIVSRQMNPKPTLTSPT